MSVKGIHWAQSVHGVGPFKKCLLLNLGERHHIDTGICTVDQMMLARDSDMTDRTARKYLKELEEQDKLITRKLMRSGKGWQTHYVLHFDRTEPQPVEGSRKDVPAQKPALSRNAASGSNEVSAGTQLPDPTGTQLPDPTGTCVPAHKEHEGYTKDSRSTSDLKSDTSGSRKTKTPPPLVDDTPILEAFEKLWAIWPAKGRERSQSKADCLHQLRRCAKLQPVASLVIAARAFAAKTEAQYVPGLDRWLKQGRYEHFLPKDLAERAAAAPREAPTESPPDRDGNPVDWDAAVAKYVRSGIWPRHLGDRPDDPDYRGPLAPLEAIMANGKYGQLHVKVVAMNIDRLRAAKRAAA